MLLVVNFAWSKLDPLRNVPHTSQPPAELTKAAMLYKFNRLKEEKSSPDVFIIGSSLPMCAFFYAECPPYFDLKEGQRIRDAKINLLQAYPLSGYLTHTLQKAGRPNHVFNFSGAACMVSDASVILDNSIAIGKTPKTVVYGVGLRDFVDNVNPPPGETPIYTSLCNFSYILKHLPETVNLPAFPNLMVSSVCSPYGQRNEFKLAVEHVLCNFFHRQTNLQIAFTIAAINQQLKQAAAPPVVPAAIPSKLDVEKHPMQVDKQSDDQKPEPKLATEELPQSPKKIELSSLDYAQRYYPANYRRMEQEFAQLDRLIQRCKEKNIQLILINMPVSSGHPRLSPPGLREKYLRLLKKEGQKADIYLDYENNKLFVDSDFFDTVHLNADGAHKFIDDMVAKLPTR